MIPRTSIYLLYALLLVSLLLVKESTQSTAKKANTANSNRSNVKQTIVRWYEEEDDHEAVDSKASRSRPKRKGIWGYGRMNDRAWLGDADSRSRPREQQQQQLQPESSTSTPHPLRTDAWKLTVQWRRNTAAELELVAKDRESGVKQRKREKKDLRLDFADNGYVRVHHQQDSSDATAAAAAATPLPIGTWKIDPAGLSWRLSLNGVEHYFFTDMHLNPFGKHPKMTRGIILRDRRTGKNNGNSKWFRPIVATFTAVGVGNDTADLSYSHRSLGL